MSVDCVNMRNLDTGIRCVFQYVEKNNGSRKGEWDFHNALYSQLEQLKRDTPSPACWLTSSLWDILVDRLSEWRVTSRKAGVDTETIRTLRISSKIRKVSDKILVADSCPVATASSRRKSFSYRSFGRPTGVTSVPSVRLKLRKPGVRNAVVELQGNRWIATNDVT